MKNETTQTLAKPGLIEGKIPAKTQCPFKDKCEIAAGGVCNHKGVDHEVPFSCASARAFEITLT